MKRVWLWISIVGLLLVGLTGCGNDGSGQGFRLPLSAEPRQLDPALAIDEASSTVVAALFEGLTAQTESGEIVPAAAESWVISDDGLTYTFTLAETYWSTVKSKSDVTTWETPTLVTADDFVFGMQRAVNPETKSGLASRLDGIVNAAAIRQGQKPVETLGVRAVDDTHLVITLAQRDELFLTKLTGAPFYPCQRAFFEQTGGRYGLESYLISNGAFYLKTWEHGASLLLGKNTSYHEAESVLPAAIRFVINASQTPMAVTEGTLDAIRLEESDLSAAQEAGLQIVTLNDSVRSLWMNTTDGVLCNADMRRALRDGIEWETVYAYLEENGESRATGYVAPAALVNGVGCRTEQTALTFSANGTAARESWAKGCAALYANQRNVSVPSLTVLASEDRVSADVARYLVQSWQKNLNVSVSLQLVTESELTSRVKSGQYQLALYTTVANGRTAGENLRAYLNGDSGNVAGWNDGTFAGLCHKLETGTAEDLKTAERYLQQACPSLPLSFPETTYALAPTVRDLTVRPLGGEGGRFAFRQAKRFD